MILLTPSTTWNRVFYPLRKLVFSFVVILFLCSTVDAQNCTVNAGFDVSVCAGTTQIQTGGNIGGNYKPNTLIWTQVGTTPSVATITNSNSLSPTFSNLSAPGTYTFQIQAGCTVGGNATDMVVYTVKAGATAVAPSNVVATCYTPGTSINLTGTAPTGHTLTWSFVGSNAPTSGTLNGNTSTSATGNNPTLQFSAPPPTYCVGFSGSQATINVRSTNNSTGCYVDNAVTVFFSFKPGAVTATGSGGGCGPAALLGSCANDGTGTWTVVSKPAGSPAVTFSPNANSSSVTPGGLASGNYTFKWTVVGSSCSDGNASVTIAVGSGGGGSVTVPDVKSMQFCPGSLPSTISLTGTLPKSGETVSWTKLSGGSATITNATSPMAQASGLSEAGAPYIFQYTITGSGCPRSDTMQVSVSRSLTYQPTNSGSCSSDFYNVQYFGPSQLGTIPFLQADSIPIGLIYESGPATNLQLYFKASMKDANGNYTGTSYYSPEIDFSRGQTANYTYKGNTLWPTYNQLSATLSASITTQNTVTGCYNAVPGVYRFRLMLKDNCGTFISEPFEITIGANTGLNAGSDQRVICGSTSTTLAGSFQSNRCEITPYWTTARRPTGAADPIIGSNKFNSNAPLSSLSTGTYVFVWQSDQGSVDCGISVPDSVKITVSAAPPAVPTVTGGVLLSCKNKPISISGSLNDDATDGGKWTVSSVLAGGAYTISPNSTSPNIIFTPQNALTTYTLTWTVSNACGSSSASTVVSTSSTTATVPNINNPDNCSATNGLSFSLSATGGPATWSSNNPNYTINSSTGAVTPTKYNPTKGAVTFYYATLAANACGIMKDSVTFSSPATPTMATTTFCNINSFSPSPTQSLSISGLLPYTTYQVVSLTGPGTNNISPMTFTPTTSSATLNLTASQEGKYTIVIQGGTGNCNMNTTTFTVQLYATPGFALAGPDMNLCGASNTTALNAQPNPLGSSFGAWSVANVYKGYAPVFSDASSPTSNVTFSQGGGDVLLRWAVTGSNASCNNSTEDYVRVRYVPAAIAGNDKFTCYDASASPAALILDGNTPGAGNGLWTVLSKPSANPSPSFIDATVAKTTITGLKNGVYTLKWTITDTSKNGCPVTSSNVMASVYFGCIALPVEVLSFSAEAGKQDVHLNWVMSSEEENSQYIPERSLSPQGPFYSMSTVDYNKMLDGKYSYDDKNAIAAGTNYLYYRLAVRSVSNKLSYSKIVAVRLQQEGNIQLYPTITERGNPINIIFNKNNIGTCRIKTVSINGQLMNEQTVNNPKAIKISTGNLTAGSYFIQVNNDQQSYVFKILIK